MPPPTLRPRCPEPHVDDQLDLVPSGHISPPPAPPSGSPVLPSRLDLTPHSDPLLSPTGSPEDPQVRPLLLSRRLTLSPPWTSATLAPRPPEQAELMTWVPTESGFSQHHHAPRAASRVQGFTHFPGFLAAVILPVTLRNHTAITALRRLEPDGTAQSWGGGTGKQFLPPVTWGVTGKLARGCGASGAKSGRHKWAPHVPLTGSSHCRMMTLT